MCLDRRQLLGFGGAVVLAAGIPVVAHAQARGHSDPSQTPARRGALVGVADYTIRIATGLVELAPEVTISTKLYNGQFPGPLLRMREGRRVVIDVYNDTDTPEQLHWHGQFLLAQIDGALEEGTPFIPAHGMRRIAFTPGPAGFRFYHTASRSRPRPLRRAL